ncbi:hypothetical protein [Morganella morganii IS15]|nr:hypothetical protein [Morganella morganii IS15]
MNNKCVFPGNNRGIYCCLLIPVILLLITGCVYKPEGPYFEVRFQLTNYFGQLRATAF